jgi:hypothetical protein
VENGDWPRKLQALVDAGEITERAMKRYLLPEADLLGLLDSDVKEEVVADLNSVVNAVQRSAAKVRRR